ncbi:MAG: tetratricopeptide repeat protein [Dongiaceae bacterium]
MLKNQALKFVPTAPVWEAVLDVWRRAVDRLGMPVAPPPGSASGWEALYVRAHESLRVGALDTAAELFAELLSADSANPAAALQGRRAVRDLLGWGGVSLGELLPRPGTESMVRRGMPDRHFAVRSRGMSVAEILAYTKVLRAGHAKRRPHAYFGRGNAYLASGRPKLALLDYAFALRLDPNLANVLALRGEALVVLGRHDKALAELDRAVRIEPANAEITGSRAIARLALGRLEEADIDWRRQLELLPGDNAPARASVLLRLADYAAALPALEAARRAEPADPYWRLYHYTALARLDRAPAQADGAAVPSDWPGPLLALHAGRSSPGEVLTRADNTSRHAEALFQLGVLAASAGAPGQARQHWTKVVEIAAPEMIEHAAARHELRRPGE